MEKHVFKFMHQNSVRKCYFCQFHGVCIRIRSGKADQDPGDGFATLILGQPRSNDNFICRGAESDCGRYLYQHLTNARYTFSHFFGSVFTFHLIRIQHFRLNTDPYLIRIQCLENMFFHKLQFTSSYPYASIKDVQTTEEAFSPQKRTSST